jgi:hypothetical protein
MILMGGAPRAADFTAVVASRGAMLSLWRAEDFGLLGTGLNGAKDHWEPVTYVVAASPEMPKSEFGSQHGDFWDPLPRPSKTDSLSLRQSEWDWFDYVELPLFEARAAEHPFLLPRARTRAETLSVRRARWLLSLLDVSASNARRAFLGVFVELFEHFNHVNTFRALSELALDDASADEILTAFHLKLVWAEYPKFWSIRQTRLGAPFVPQNGQAVLTWTRAVRLAILSKGLPAECIIQYDWYEEWLQIPFGDPAFWSFIDYATLRLEAFSAGALELPTELRRKNERGLPPSFGGNSLDGTLLGSRSRTGQLVRLTTDSWALSSVTNNAPEIHR